MSQLFSHMSTNDLLEPYQSACKPNHGTETALLKVKNDILCALDNKKAVYLVLLDVSAAFDTIDFDVLNERLANSLLINGTVRSWIMSYLQGRNSHVSIAGNLSEPQTMNFGLPQRSVVGPGMFSYYTYPLGKIIQKHNLKYHIHREIVPPRETVAIARVAIAIVGRGGWGSLLYTVANENQMKA